MKRLRVLSILAATLAALSLLVVAGFAVPKPGDSPPGLDSPLPIGKSPERADENDPRVLPGNRLEEILPLDRPLPGRGDIKYLVIRYDRAGSKALLMPPYVIQS